MNKSGQMDISFRGKSVLIIDPADTVRTTIAAMLKQLEFAHVEQSARLSHAKELLEKTQFDIIICEQHPPEVDGLTLLKALRSDKHTEQTTFVIISASLDQRTVIEAVRSGVSEFIVKPFSLKTFKQRLKRAVAVPVKSLPGQPKKDQSQAIETSENLETTSILVVDDVPDNIKVISEVIRSDYQVKAATSGEKALKICLSKSPPDLVLLDIMMPEMDGLTVCQKLKSHPNTQHITVIFVSAMDQTEDVVKGLELGAVDYITKPINPDILKARVKTHVKIARSTKTLREQVDLMVDYAQLRSEFDRVIQQDMKRPFESISNTVRELEIYYDEPQKVLKSSQKLKEVCSTANSYMENLTLVQQFEDNKYEFNPMAVNLNDMARDAAEHLKSMRNARYLKWNMSDEVIHMIHGEDSLVRITLMNLFKNAIEASQENQEVVVDFHIQGKNIVCSIHNQGLVPLQIQERFFDKYVSWGKPEGSGLGTYIAKLLTETQQGKIWYETQDNEGTKVFLQYRRVI